MESTGWRGSGLTMSGRHAAVRFPSMARTGGGCGMSTNAVSSPRLENTGKKSKQRVCLRVSIERRKRAADGNFGGCTGITMATRRWQPPKFSACANVESDAQMELGAFEEDVKVEVGNARNPLDFEYLLPVQLRVQEAPIEEEEADEEKELKSLKEMAKYAKSLGLEVHAGHGLTYNTVTPIAALPEVMELNIGHFLIGEAIFLGLHAAIKDMRRLMINARNF